MERPAAAVLLAWLGLFGGCAQPSLPEGAATAAAADACEALLQAPPGLWASRVPPVVALGGDARLPLERGLARSPHAPGAQPAARVLARLADPRSEAVLTELLRLAPAATAAEAATGLGRIGSPTGRSRLVDAVADEGLDPLPRTAAACALLDQGVLDPSVDFLCAVLTAATPAGTETTLRWRLPPARPRWALERTLAIDAIARRSAGERFGLDADAPWPQLAAATERARSSLLAAEAHR